MYKHNSLIKISSFWKPKPSGLKKPNQMVFTSQVIQNLSLDLNFTWVYVDIKTRFYLGLNF